MLAPRSEVRMTVSVIMPEAESIGRGRGATREPGRRQGGNSGLWLWWRHGPGLLSIHLASWGRPGWAEERDPAWRGARSAK